MFILAILLVLLGSCMDYTNLSKKPHENFNFSPKINSQYISPHPNNMVIEINIGNNCQGQVFKIPPIKDYDKEDNLYYLWFLDNKLAIPQATISAENKNTSVVTFILDKQFIMSHFKSKIPNDFFTKVHILEFFISDQPYSIPETRMMENYGNNQTEHQDYTYWIVTFSDNPC